MTCSQCEEALPLGFPLVKTIISVKGALLNFCTFKCFFDWVDDFRNYEAFQPKPAPQPEPFDVV